jgi:hypothetical protein
MALYSRPEFAEAFSISQGNLTNYIARKNITLQNGQIDSQEEKNALWIKKRIAKLAKSPEKGAKTVDNTPTKTTKSVKKEKKAEKEQKGTDLSSLDNMKIQAQVNKLTIEERLKQIELLKLEGKLIPTEMTKGVFIKHSKSITTAFHNGLEDWIVILAAKKSFTAEEVADIRDKTVKMINHANKEALATSLQDIDNIVKEYSEAKAITS